MAGQRPRTPEPGAAGGHHGGWQARHCQGPGIDGYPERPAAPDAERGAGKCGTRDGSGRPAASQREDHFRRFGTWRQSADALRADGKAGNSQGTLMTCRWPADPSGFVESPYVNHETRLPNCKPLEPCGLPQDLKRSSESIKSESFTRIKGDSRDGGLERGEGN